MTKRAITTAGESRREDERQHLRAQRQAGAWSWVLSDTRGRLVLQQIIELGGIYDETFTASSRDAYLAGKRMLALSIRQTVKDVDPDLPGRMEAEYARDPPNPIKRLPEDDDE